MDGFFYIDETVRWGFTFNFIILLVLWFAKRWREFIKQWRLASYFIGVVFCAIVLIEFATIFVKNPEAMRNTDGYTTHFALFNFLAVVLFMPARIRNSFAWGVLYLIT